MPHLLRPVVDGGALYDDGQVPARTDGDLMADDLIAQEIRVVVRKPQTVVFLVLVPFLQLDDHVDLLGVLDGLEAEEVLDVDDADAPKLDEVLGHLRSGADEGIVGHLADLHHVVRYQTVAPLYKLQSGLGLTYAGVAHDQDALAVNIHQNAVDADAGSQLHLEPADHLTGKVRGGLLRDQAGDPPLGTDGQHIIRRLVGPGEDQAGDVVGQELFKAHPGQLIVHAVDVFLLHIADDLDTAVVKVIKKACQLKGRTVHIVELDGPG